MFNSRIPFYRPHNPAFSGSRTSPAQGRQSASPEDAPQPAADRFQRQQEGAVFTPSQTGLASSPVGRSAGSSGNPFQAHYAELSTGPDESSSADSSQHLMTLNSYLSRENWFSKKEYRELCEMIWPKPPEQHEGKPDERLPASSAGSSQSGSSSAGSPRREKTLTPPVASGSPPQSERSTSSVDENDILQMLESDSDEPRKNDHKNEKPESLRNFSIGVRESRKPKRSFSSLSRMMRLESPSGAARKDSDPKNKKSGVKGGSSGVGDSDTKNLGKLYSTPGVPDPRRANIPIEKQKQMFLDFYHSHQKELERANIVRKFGKEYFYLPSSNVHAWLQESGNLNLSKTERKFQEAIHAFYQKYSNEVRAASKKNIIELFLQKKEGKDCSDINGQSMQRYLTRFLSQNPQLQNAQEDPPKTSRQKKRRLR